jgi:hypothetical protein
MQLYVYVTPSLELLATDLAQWCEYSLIAQEVAGSIPAQ